MQVAVIGGVYFIALPGEVYHRVGLDIRNGLKGNSCILATLANGNYGYIPTADMFSTDVYEIQLCGNSFLPEETAELITRTVLRLAVADRLYIRIFLGNKQLHIKVPSAAVQYNKC